MDVSSEPEHKAYKETGFCQHLLSLSVTFFFFNHSGITLLFIWNIYIEGTHPLFKQTKKSKTPSKSQDLSFFRIFSNIISHRFWAQLLKVSNNGPRMKETCSFKGTVRRTNSFGSVSLFLKKPTLPMSFVTSTKI